MLRIILISLLTLGVIGTTYWGYKEHEQKNALLIHAENNYQRSFHELTYHMDLLHDQIGTSLAMNSGEKLSPQFVEIWRITAEALINVSQLPLTLLPFEKTEEFLSRIGYFTYQTAIRNLDDDPLTEEEINQLTELYEDAASIKDELRMLQHEALENNLRWMDVELALATANVKQDDRIIDGLQSVENYVGDWLIENEGTTFLQTLENKNPLENITGDLKTEEDILDYTKDLFSIKDEINIEITKSGDGAEIPFYTVFYEDGKRVYMDITETGGYPLNILVERPIKESKQSLNDGMLKAEQYLKQFGYENMRLLNSQQFDQVGVYTFLFVQDDIRIFPDSIVVKVALDNGDILGLNTKDYLANHRERTIEQPKTSLDEAKDKVNKQLEIQDEHLSLIENSLGHEVLTYEFVGILHDETYRIFINAETGAEEKVEKLSGTEMNFSIN